jgi:hypothetical protein
MHVHKARPVRIPKSHKTQTTGVVPCPWIPPSDTEAILASIDMLLKNLDVTVPPLKPLANWVDLIRSSFEK